MHHVIIGAGPAAVSAAEHIRKLEPTHQVTMLAAEDVPPYSRMAIPYYLVGDIQPEGTYLRKSATHFQDHGIEIRHARASSVDSAAKTVHLLGGDSIRYDKLLLATGATAVKPPLDGIDLDGVYNCWSLADAHKIVARAEQGSKVILMGAGFIGCIILESLAKRKVDLTVIEMDSRMVPRMTNETMGTMIKHWCESQGIKVLTSTRVASIAESNDHPLAVTIESGDALPADVVICATGVRSNTGFLKDSGIEVNHGVVVDEYMHTNLEGVYAAGDVCQGRDLSTGEFQVQAIQTTAVEQGKVAAQNMCRGHKTPHIGNLNMNVLDTVGLISTSFGLWMGVKGGEEVERSDPENYKYLNLQFQDDVLVGASSLGMTQHVGVMRGLIQSGAHLGDWKDRLLEEPTCMMEAYLATSQAQDARSAAV